jgi:hypothetical protein
VTGVDEASMNLAVDDRRGRMFFKRPALPLVDAATARHLLSTSTASVTTASVNTSPSFTLGSMQYEEVVKVQ